MSAPKSGVQPRFQQGYTLVELSISMFMISVILLTFFVFFRSNLFNYINLQADASTMTQLNTQADRVAQVMREATNITSASANDIVFYTYFFPSDTYVSLVHYYLQTSAGITKVLADVTPMTANPPIGTPIVSGLKTYTIIDSYYQPVGGTLFTYLDSASAPLTLPISDLQTIKGIQVNLAAKTSGGNNQAINVQVGLRNRKTNL